MTPYEKYLCASAEFEVQQLKESGQEFILDKEGFDPDNVFNCFYGQVFESSNSDKAVSFKRGNSIRFGFGKTDLNSSTETALENLLCKLWDNDKQEQVYKIVEQFATWKNDSTKDVTENLFTL